MATSGTDLKVERIKARVSQVALARAMDVHRATIHRYEGLAAVPADVVRAYLRGLATLDDVAERVA